MKPEVDPAPDAPSREEIEARGALAVLQLQMQIVQLQRQILAYQLRDAEAHLALVLGDNL